MWVLNLKLKKSRLWHSYWNVTFRYPSLHTFFTIVFDRKPIEDMAGRWAMSPRFTPVHLLCVLLLDRLVA